MEETSQRFDISGLDQNGRGQVVARSSAKRTSGFRRTALVTLAVLGGGIIIWQALTPRTPVPAAAAPAPVAVSVQTVGEQRLRIWNDFSGRLRAIDSRRFARRSAGRITEVRFHDGQSVRTGDVLLVIEPLPYEAAEARAQARIATAKANLQLAAANHARNVNLLHTKVISPHDFDQTDNANQAAAAEVLAAEADLKTAQVDLDHAYVKAPISGRVSRAELTVGNFVQNGAAAPLLTSVVSENGVYADFEVDEQTYLSTIRNAAVGNTQEGTIPVELTLPGDTRQTQRGFIQNFDNQLDPRSGTIRARARFDNTDGTLMPGMFVSVHLASSRERQTLCIPARAIGFDQSKKFVFVVSADHKVVYREVELGSAIGGQRVVLKGLAPGERVIVDGIQRVRADAVVDPQEVAPASDDAVKTAQAAVTSH